MARTLATVTALAPLQVLLDGSTTPAPAQNQVAGYVPDEGDRVFVELVSGRLYIFSVFGFDGPPAGQDGEDGTSALTGLWSVDRVEDSGSTHDLVDRSIATIHYITLTADCTLTFPEPEIGLELKIILEQDDVGERLAVWPLNVQWEDETPPVLTEGVGKKDVFEFVCVDGEKFIGSVVGQNYGITVLSGYLSEVLADAPIMYWRCGEASGTTLVDASGNGYDAALLGSYSLGTAGLLTSDSDTAITFTNGRAQQATPPTISGSYTIEMIVTPQSSFAGGVVCGSRQPTDCGMQLVISSTGTQAAFGNGSGWITTSASTSGSHFLNTRYHLVFEVDDATHTWTTYVDGVAEGSGSYSGTAVLTDGTHDFYFGDNGRNDGYSQPGIYDEVAVYDYALGAIRVAAHYSEL